MAVNLAAMAGNATYIDCDVEEPNGRLFFKPKHVRKTKIYTQLPEFDSEKCSGCKKCVQFCRFHALIYVKDKPMVFSEVCHSCGGCQIVCPEGAITEKEKPIGTLEIGTQGALKIVTGVLNPGEASGIPIIRRALKEAGDITIIDCPPGSSCSVMESIMEADYCVIVAEPTAFGFHNFQMVYELTTLLGKPCAVVINKEEEPFEPLEIFCRDHKIPVLAHIPYDTAFASLASEGQLVCEKSEEAKKLFAGLLQKIGGVI